MKFTKEVTLKIELTGDEVNDFLEIIEKVVLSESASHLGIGILSNKQTDLLKDILKNKNN